jgi:hypothetical protein
VVRRWKSTPERAPATARIAAHPIITATAATSTVEAALRTTFAATDRRAADVQ